MGRPSRYNEDIAGKLAAAVSGGAPALTACKLSGIGETTYYTWLKRYPDFAAQMAKAEAIRTETLRKRVELYGDAKEDWKAHTWLLERTSKDYREVKKTEVAVQKGVEEVFDAVREHMSESAYMELINAVAIVSGMDPAEEGQPDDSDSG